MRCESDTIKENNTKEEKLQRCERWLRSQGLADCLRGEELGLTEEEVAFYNALETNDSTIKVLGEDNLQGIARELVETARNNVAID